MVSIFRYSDTIKKNAFLTTWSFIHFLSGAMSYIYLRKIFKVKSVTMALLIMLIGHTMYEIKDLQHYVNDDVKVTYWNNNSLINSLGDTFSAIAGFYLAVYLEYKNIEIDLIYSTTICTIIVSIFLINKLG